MWEYVLGGAAIFGLIVGLFAVYNGRVTTREIGKMIAEEGKAMRKILIKLSEQHATMIGLLKSSRGRELGKRKRGDNQTLKS